MNKNKRLHTCKITMLGEQENVKQLKVKGLILMSQYLSDVQVIRKSDGKYFSAAICTRRGAVAEEDVKPEIFDIACNPSGKSDEIMVKRGYLTLIKEKIRNDLVVYRKLLDSMNIRKCEITMEDVSNYLKKKE